LPAAINAKFFDPDTSDASGAWSPEMIWRALRTFAWTLAWVIALGCAAWTFGALHYDFPVGETNWSRGRLLPPSSRRSFFVRGAAKKVCAVFLAFGLGLIWWLTLKPSNDGNWQPDVAQTAWADINGDEFTFHNVRNCDYRTRPTTRRIGDAHRAALADYGYRSRHRLLGFAVDCASHR
jgi:hypothetical protein